MLVLDVFELLFENLVAFVQFSVLFLDKLNDFLSLLLRNGHVLN